MIKTNIGFIGAGNMASALIKGIISKKIIEPKNILIFDIDRAKSKILKNKYKLLTVDSLNALIKKSDVIFLSIKPQTFSEIISDFKKIDFKNKCIVSIMAGVNTKKLQNAFNNAEIIRTMPNTAALVAESMTGIYFTKISKIYKNIAIKIFSSIGKYMIVDNEDDINAITAVSGSGPAYLFYIVEAFEELNKKLKFTDTELRNLILTTFKGAINLIETTKVEPVELRNKVTSPGGTTQAAIEIFESNNLKKIIQTGVLAAQRRSVELSKM